MAPRMKMLSILGIRGIPADHGGFESFAQQLALYLLERDWKVVVYCQKNGSQPLCERSWRGVELIDIYVQQQGPLGTFVFDWKCIVHAAKSNGLILTLGYNTAIFSVWTRLRGVKNVMNMDGIEWHRQKWNLLLKIWFFINEKLGSWLANHLVADHPEIEKHLRRNVSRDKITMIPYGAIEIKEADVELIAKSFGLQSRQYGVVIARPEPENSIFEIVTAFSQQNRNFKLVVLGDYSRESEYHSKILSAASDEVLFLGAIYNPEIVGALRFHAAFYVHGHQVGGTNPSLVESMGAGNPVIAHDNKFNRWVAGDQQFYFSNIEECGQIFKDVLLNKSLLTAAGIASRNKFLADYTWPAVLKEYERLLERFL